YAEKGGTLSLGALLDVAKHLSIVRSTAHFLGADLPELQYIDGITSVLYPDKNLEERIGSAILSETEVSDAASPQLRRIRRAISVQNDGIRAHLNKMITSASYKDMLRDQIVTIRDGRFCLPVRQEYRQRFPGIIHDQSRGGGTLFMEPQAVVDMNNKLRELELEEAAEIERILAELSAAVGACAHLLRLNQELLVRLDLIFAKAKLSDDMKAAEPQINEDGQLGIVRGRHPLLDKDKVVPVSLSLGGEFTTLVITGPNTGGKTVTLKTVGLFILMAEAGLHIPAQAANIPLMKQVCADIGDEQSIEQSLSTFSAHMTNIVDIVREADEQTFIFLDELGAGTDPAEGAALAVSILETLRFRRALVMATTHYTELKKYALQQDGVQNASMEFDVETLSPTYKLIIGTPGRSNAFEISRKLGLPEEIVTRASGLMDEGSLTFDKAVSRVETDRRAAERAREEAEALRAEAMHDRETLDKKITDFESKREHLLDKAHAEAAEKLAEAAEYAEIIRAELKSILDDAEDLSGQRGDFFRRLDENKKLLRALDAADAPRKKNRISGASDVQERNKPLRAEGLRIGDRVKILSMDQKGEVLSVDLAKKEAQILVGRLKMTVPVTDLAKSGDQLPASSGSSENRGTTGTPAKKTRSAASENAGGGYSSLVRGKVSSVAVSVDVRGENLDAAQMIVDKYLDDAFLAGLHEVTIIHGRGDGILRSGLRKLFKGDKRIKSFRSGGPGEGSDGVTIVQMS
ncbi:MAG: endonuclease MutS2, partial [Clostridiales Family XIII bacterium]|nr:endonuclease MutS2 [Clostridiales Family XIII bacterium]